MTRSPNSVFLSVVFSLIVWIALTTLPVAYPRVFNASVCVLLLAVFPLVTVAIGFSFRLPKVAGVLLPALKDNQAAVSLDGIPLQPFQQGITYLVQMRNLWLLTIPPLISFALWAAVDLHWIVDMNENPLPLYGAVAAVAAAMYIALRWLHERFLLRMNCSGFVQILGVRRSEVSYQFFDHRGDRRGGITRYKRAIAAGHLLPIFIDRLRPDSSLLFASFCFFHFQVADARHVTPGSLPKRLDA